MAQNVAPGANFRTPKYRPNPANGGPIGGRNAFGKGRRSQILLESAIQIGGYGSCARLWLCTGSVVILVRCFSGPCVTQPAADPRMLSATATFAISQEFGDGDAASNLHELERTWCTITDVGLHAVPFWSLFWFCFALMGTKVYIYIEINLNIYIYIHIFDIYIYIYIYQRPKKDGSATPYPPVCIVGSKILETFGFSKQFFSGFFAPQGPGMGPKCGPGGRPSNVEVSSESSPWRPDWWQKHVLKKTQEPTIVGANYTSLGVPRQLAVRAQGCSGSQNFGTPGTL